MLFKYPALLYFLAALAIPIIVHLFQLRKFKRIPFTNVAFLKPLTTQTRKSQKIKKWLILLSRLLMIACFVLAFAQPYIPSNQVQQGALETVIYLDNSYSMQAKGPKGQLFNSAVTELATNLPADEKFHLILNDNSFVNINKQQFLDKTLTANFTSSSLTLNQISLKAEALYQNQTNNKQLIVVSDFQQSLKINEVDSAMNFNTKFVPLKPENTDNISIDSVYITRQSVTNGTLHAILSSNYEVPNPITISLFNSNILVSKTSTSLSSGLSSTIEMNVNLQEPLVGSIKIEDKGLSFDNSLFLNTGQREKIKVLSVNNTDAIFLKKIFTSDEFDYISATSKDLNYNLIKDQNLVVLNELTSIPGALASELREYSANGGSIIIIPGIENTNYTAVSGFQNSETTIAEEKKITQIIFDHPVLKDVFNKKVTNFQYPSVNSRLTPKVSTQSILNYEDGTSFLYQSGSTYVFTAALNSENSNFKNSPLIVPILYNIGRNSLPLPELYLVLGKDSNVAIPVSLDKDEVLQIQAANETTFIPQQRAFDNFVKLTLGSELKSPGNYKVQRENQSLANLSFNDSRVENILSYTPVNELDNEKVVTDIGQFFSDLKNKSSNKELWVYFVMAGLFFLLCEILILKFV